MQKHEIISQIGTELYTRACVQARAAAPFTGQSGAPFTFDSTVAHEINNIIWSVDAALTDSQTIELLFAVYTDMPCYALLMEVPIHYDHQLSIQAKALFWQEVRQLLAQDDDALAEPIAYLLWCDFFEYDDRCTDAWNEVIHEAANENSVRRILAVAGPVPFHLKEPLYAKLLPDRSWHQNIFLSLRASHADIYGQIDTSKASEILNHLSIPSMAGELQQLKLALQAGQDST